MVEKQELLTQDGYNKLEEELEYLKTVKRKEVAERLKVAISFGDLSENAEYDEAKNEQAKLEEQILKLDEKLRKAVIIDESQIQHMQFGVLAQLGEHLPYKQRVTGSSPVGPVSYTHLSYHYKGYRKTCRGERVYYLQKI